jgi:hypothetical protein
MRGNQPRIRNQLAKNVTLGEQFRDAQKGLDVIPITAMRKTEMAYSEPMVLGNLSRQPDAIEVIRVIDLQNQERSIPAGGLCHFVWLPDKGGANIGSVDGMSVASNGGRKYRFTIRLTYAPVGGFNG